MNDDPFRYCVYCKADCYEDEPEHADGCPASTGVYEVRIEGPNRPCEHCGWYDDPPMLCSGCEEPLYLGDHYTHRVIDHSEPQILEPVCLGCAAQEALTP